MESKELEIILKRHTDYFLGNPDGVKANLWGADLMKSREVES